MKHSPGPWKHDFSGINHKVVTPNGREWLIGDAIYHQEDFDAQLIAAAPALLEAAKEVMKKIDEIFDGIKGIPVGREFELLESMQSHLKCAIWKAIGES